MLLATWNTKFKAPISTRMFPIRRFSSITDKSTEDVYVKDLTGNKLNSEGDKGFEFMVDNNMAEAINARSFNGKEMTAYLVDASQSIIGTSSDGTKFEGYDVMVHFGAPKFAADGEKMMQPCTISFLDPFQLSENGAVIEPKNQSAGWNPLTEFDGVYDVNLSLVGSTSATVATIAVNIANIAATNNLSFVDGLVKADFVQKSSAGVVKTITGTVVSNGDSTYTITSSFATGDTISLVACGSISLTSYKIEMVAPISVGTVS
jgi:hypothetical protein